ncbi:hypothetical protein [Sphingobacterium griseoflavum]|uniref:DUF4328 domain-containing protein n=1 Tax=Sphingobacterium griseoflavum TaxID=1474952 RepID=A0ABQ3HS99_9SPHI|nr:hypothetical protein [Sphingobacterium griseoflavum]GHE29492.1 hypothetical protein GCM10017764_10490 [Sphingobacterium griseoflavum]
MFEMLPEYVTEEMLYAAFIAGAVRIVIWIFFAYTIYSTLKLVKKENQNILPSQAWFVALPLFNIFWNFEVVRRLTDSLNNEFYDRQIEVDERPTQKWGMWFAWTFLISFLPLPMFILIVVSVLHLVYFITYWVKIHEHKVLLKMHIAQFGEDYNAKKEDED